MGGATLRTVLQALAEFTLFDAPTGTATLGDIKSPLVIKKEIRVLMIEDTAPDVLLINHELRKAGLRFRSRRVETRDSFLHELEHHTPDVILSDHGVPGFDGFAALAEARDRCPDVPFIFVSGGPDGRTVEETLKSGADDYVLKQNLHLLAPAIERVLRDADTRARHRQLESALLDAEEHLRLVSAELKEYSAFMLDRDGRVATWNPGAEQMLGFEPNEILGEHYSRLFPPESRTEGRPAFLLEEAQRKDRGEESGKRCRKNGESFSASHAVVVVRSEGGQLRGFLSIVRDLSPRAAATEPGMEDLDRSDADAKYKELETFTHSVAADLRMPLRHIESFSEVLLKTATDRLDGKSCSYLKSISQAAHKMSKLIDDLFTFSRIGQTDMYRLHLSLADIVKEVIHDLRPEWEGRSVEWKIHDLPEVEGDPVMLWLVLTNLVSNALKFTRPRETAVIEISATRGKSETEVCVRDNGVGFDPQRAQKLFQVFERLHGNEFEGTGVGLVNVRRIVERHGGRVWAHARESEGAAFYFSLPGA
ncbi:MAG TPA: ATP-binding protein [Verrucomicrobiae bacterium]|nr:ATP-binding protein [Verrucomicrobiae bacterium]